MKEKKDVVRISVTFNLDLALARAQRDYCINECGNHGGDERDTIYQGIVNLFDYLIDEALEAKKGYVGLTAEQRRVIAGGCEAIPE